MTARSRRFGLGALAGTAAVLLASLAPFALLVGPARGAEEVRSEPFTVSGAQLRWGINHESNNRAFAPGTHNFFSAGVVPDPGTGGTTLEEQDWRAESGNVRIEKQQADGTYAPATWAGLATAPDGTPIASATSGRFSNHQVVVSGGSGSVDPTTGFAEITWQGSFTVLYYSGMSFFTVTDPTLTVTPERAQLTATLGGFASDMEDQTQWTPMPPTRVVLADLPLAEVDLTSADGFASTPAYLGVGWQAPSGESAQVDGPWRGAFPSSFLDFLSSAGTAGYWYSTGGATDAYKPALPLTVSWAGASIATPSASASPTSKPTSKPTKGPTKSPTKGPPSSPAATPTDQVPSPTPRTTPPSVLAPVVEGPGSSSVDGAAAPPQGEPTAQAAPLAISPVLVSAATPPPAALAADTDPDRHLLWLLGCVLLLGALATTLISTSLVSTSVEGKK